MYTVSAVMFLKCAAHIGNPSPLASQLKVPEVQPSAAQQQEPALTRRRVSLKPPLPVEARSAPTKSESSPSAKSPPHEAASPTAPAATPQAEDHVKMLSDAAKPAAAPSAPQSRPTTARHTAGNSATVAPAKAVSSKTARPVSAVTKPAPVSAADVAKKPAAEARKSKGELPVAPQPSQKSGKELAKERLLRRTSYAQSVPKPKVVAVPTAQAKDSQAGGPGSTAPDATQVPEIAAGSPPPSSGKTPAVKLHSYSPAKTCGVRGAGAEVSSARKSSITPARSTAAGGSLSAAKPTASTTSTGISLKAAAAAAAASSATPSFVTKRPLRTPRGMSNVTMRKDTVRKSAPKGKQVIKTTAWCGIAYHETIHAAATIDFAHTFSTVVAGLVACQRTFLSVHTKFQGSALHNI